VNALCRAKPCITCKLHFPRQRTPTPASSSSVEHLRLLRDAWQRKWHWPQRDVWLPAESKSCVVCGSSSAGHVAMQFLKLTCGSVGLLLRHTRTCQQNCVLEFLFSNFFQNACFSKRETNNTQISETPLGSQFITQLGSQRRGIFRTHTCCSAYNMATNRSHTESTDPGTPSDVPAEFANSKVVQNTQHLPGIMRLQNVTKSCKS
jgi:hypothetical protein